MPESVDLGYAFKLEPRRAVEYFRSKGYNITWNWQEQLEATHIRAFTVAKAAKMDVLQTLRQGMDQALAEGQTARQFIDNVKPHLQKQGWWGKKEVIGPHGKQTVQLGSHRRLRTIFRTNMRTAYARARQQAHQANVDSRPYWQYQAVNDSRTRPDHAALDGQVFRADDPIWDTHYPPNGWGCRCSVRALTQSQVEARGLKVQSSKGKLKQVQQIAATDKVTGEVTMTQGTAFKFKGSNGRNAVLTPDPGWSYNPGKVRPTLDAKGAIDPALEELVAGQRTFKDFGLSILARTLAALRQPDPKRRSKVSAEPPAEELRLAVAQLATALDLPPSGIRRIKTPDGLDDVVIDRSLLPHIVEKRKQAREQFANYILPTLQRPLEVWLQRYKDGSYRRRFIAQFDDSKDGRASLFVVRENKDGSIAWNFVSTKQSDYIDKQRRGFLLYRKSQ